jgi:hypothetical protein
MLFSLGVIVYGNIEDLSDSLLQPARFSLALEEARNGGWVDAKFFRESFLAVDPSLEHADLDFDPLHC